MTGCFFRLGIKQPSSSTLSITTASLSIRKLPTFNPRRLPIAKMFLFQWWSDNQWAFEKVEEESLNAIEQIYQQMSDASSRLRLPVFLGGQATDTSGAEIEL